MKEVTWRQSLGGKIRAAAGKRLFREASIFALGNTLNAALPFFLLPILTHKLSPEAFGAVTVFQVLMAFAQPLVGLNLNGAVARAYYKYSPEDFARYVGNCLAIIFTCLALVFVAVLISRDWLATVTQFPADWILLAPLAGLGLSIHAITLAILQVSGRTLGYILLQLGLSGLNLAVSLFLVLGLEWGWQGRVLGIVGSYLGVATIAAIWLAASGAAKFRLSEHFLSRALRFGVPLLPHSLSGVVMTLLDRLFVTKYVGLGETGVYSAGYQIGMAVGLISTSINLAWAPWVYRNLSDADDATKVRIVKMTYCGFALFLGIALSVGLITPLLVPVILGHDFEGASRFIPIISLAYGLDGMYRLVVNYIFFSEKTYYLSAIALVVAGAQIGMTYVLVSRYGALGAACATLLTFSLQFVLTWIASAKACPMPWGFFRTPANPAKRASEP